MSDFGYILGDISKDRFRQSINKLLNNCFILKTPKDTASDYRFIKENEEVFEGVLDLLGYELIVRDDQGVITVINMQGSGRVRFNKLESILLLILRLLYIEKMKEVSQAKDVIVLFEDIYEKYNMLQIGRLRKDLLVNSLRKFKQYNLIQNLDRIDTGDMGIRIVVYPSILFAITSLSLEDEFKIASDRLSEFAGGDDEYDNDEESSEETD